MKKIALLTSLLALAACGGGSGGGHGGAGAIVPNEVQKPSHDKIMSDEVRASNAKLLTMDSSIPDESSRTAYLKGVLGEEEYNAYVNELMGTSEPVMASLNRAAARKATTPDKNICKSPNDCDQMMFDNMKQWLVENIDDFENVSESDMKRALKIAGFDKDLPGHWDDLKDWIRLHKDEIKAQADKVYNTPGQGKPKEFWLDNANFRALLTTGASDKMTFDIDEDTGKVIAVKFTDDGSNSSQYTPAAFYNFMKRIGDTNEFDATSSDTDGKWKLESFAKELGLKYSDFGVLTYNGTMGGNDKTGFNAPFMGGYEAKNIKKSELSSDMTFTGIAKGTVNPSNNAAAAGVKNLTIEDKNATLTFDKANGDETLTATFDNWYDVTAIKSGGIATVSFRNETGKDIAEEYQFGAEDNVKTLFETAYYGDDKEATEATALIQYQQQAKNPGTENIYDDGNINMFLGFGGKAE